MKIGILLGNLKAFLLSFQLGKKGESFKIGTLVTAIIGLAIAIMIFFALLPSIESAISDANLTGASLALAGLVTIAFIAGIIMVIVKYLIGK